MKKKLTLAVKLVIVLMVSLWILSKIPFNKTIDQEILADIYEDGVIVGQTSVKVEGKKSNYLFTSREIFIGRFQVPLYDKTVSEGMSARVRWIYEENVQDLSYMASGDYAPDIDLLNLIIINENMTEFALMDTKGTIIASSYEAYKIYNNNIFYNSVRESTLFNPNIEKLE